MTALNMWITPMAGFLLTDTARYDGAGIVRDFASKVVFSDRLQMAFARTGIADGRTTEVLSAWLDQFPDQATALRAFPRMVKDLAVRARATGEAGSSPYLPDFAQYVVVAWSRVRRRAEGFVIASSQGTLPPDMRPDILHRIDSTFAPSIDEGLLPPRGGVGFDPRGGGLAMIKVQRAERDEQGGYSIGGSAELVTVSAAGVAIERLHIWRDRPNEKIVLPWFERAEAWAIKLGAVSAERRRARVRWLDALAERCSRASRTVPDS